jgi:hypothetical protein
MFADLAPYLFLLVLGGVAAGLLTFKSLAERIVAAGMLPRAFLGLLPALQVIIRIFGAVLVIAGIIRIGAEGGWINPQTVARYGFPVAIVLLGLILLLLSPRKET